MKKWLCQSSGIMAAVAAVLLVVWFFTGLYQLRDGQSKEGLEQLERALHRAAVACYAAEGIYPPTLSYLQEHYGLQIDEDRYAVFYEIFAENMMPEITVLERDQ